MENKYYVTARIGSGERERLVDLASRQDIPYGNILRQLVRFFLRDEIGWVELFEATNDIALSERTSVTIRTRLPEDAYVAFADFAEKMGSTMSVILRRLVLLYTANKIDWRMIWAECKGADNGKQN